MINCERREEYERRKRIAIVIHWILGSIGTLLFLAIICFMCCFRVHTGEQIYTGYIYSTTTELGVPHGHIRFNQTAGEDTQPSFCVNREDREKLTSLSGSGKKVRVTEPGGVKFAWPWECGFPVSLEVLDEE